MWDIDNTVEKTVDSLIINLNDPRRDSDSCMPEDR